MDINNPIYIANNEYGIENGELPMLFMLHTHEEPFPIRIQKFFYEKTDINEGVMVAETKITDIPARGVDTFAMEEYLEDDEFYPKIEKGRIVDVIDSVIAVIRLVDENYDTVGPKYLTKVRERTLSRFGSNFLTANDLLGQLVAVEMFEYEDDTHRSYDKVEAIHPFYRNNLDECDF